MHVLCIFVFRCTNSVVSLGKGAGQSHMIVFESHMPNESFYGHIDQSKHLIWPMCAVLRTRV